MKTFEDICRMTQPQVKAYMKDYLSSKKYKVVSEDGFLYAKGTVPVLLVAHMDTVHKEQCKVIVDNNGKLSSPQGIGGDDRCGVFIIMNLVKEFNCSVLLCEDEEIGGVGARKFTNATFKCDDGNSGIIEKRYISNLDVNYMIEFDRKGNNDAIFYHCDNKDFMDFVSASTGYKFAYGSFSDISTLMSPSNLAAVNLSCGYYKAHTVDEYVDYAEMMDTIEAGRALIMAECDEPFKYVPKVYVKPTYDYSNYKYPNVNYHAPNSFPLAKREDTREEFYGNLFDGPQYSDERLYKVARNDKTVELEVSIVTLEGGEEILYVEGCSKADCWMNFFMDNPDVCFNQIADYNWG